MISKNNKGTCKDEGIIKNQRSQKTDTVDYKNFDILLHKYMKWLSTLKKVVKCKKYKQEHKKEKAKTRRKTWAAYKTKYNHMKYIKNSWGPGAVASWLVLALIAGIPYGCQF